MKNRSKNYINFYLTEYLRGSGPFQLFPSGKKPGNLKLFTQLSRGSARLLENRPF